MGPEIGVVLRAQILERHAFDHGAEFKHRELHQLVDQRLLSLVEFGDSGAYGSVELAGFLEAEGENRFEGKSRVLFFQLLQVFQEALASGVAVGQQLAGESFRGLDAVFGSVVEFRMPFRFVDLVEVRLKLGGAWRRGLRYNLFSLSLPRFRGRSQIDMGGRLFT